MTKAELTEQLAATIGKTKVNKLAKILKRQDFTPRDLADLTFDGNKIIAFRAAWLLENLFLADPLSCLPEIDHLFTRLKDVKYPGCQRHYAKIIMHLTAPKVNPRIKAILAEIDMEPIVGQCFDWMIGPEVLIAVKVFAAQALFNLRGRYPWISEELAAQLQFLMRDGSPAIQARGRKLLAQL